ncbi:MAG: YlbF family regulator [Bacilli bacterium]|nr:YlbF family regulator [Bacilli bacterium]
MNNIIYNAVDELVSEIKSLKNYIRLLELKQLIDHDLTLNTLMIEFNEIKSKYTEASVYGEYHPDLKHLKITLAQTKERLYNHPVVQEYKQLEKELQKTLDEISRKIAQTVSPKIRYPNEIGLINKH